MTSPQRDRFLVDQSTEKLDKLLSEDTLVKAGRFAQENLRPLADEVVRRHFGAASAECDPETASAVLRECIQRTTEELQRWASGYSPMRWLWMIRRLPHRVFEGHLSTTVGYDSTLVEIISGRSSCERLESCHAGDGCLAYSLEGAVVTRLARFCEGIRLLSDLHSSYRWAGKGASFFFPKGGRPEMRVESSTRSAVESYDRRVEQSGRPFARLGSVMTSMTRLSGVDSILWVQKIEPTQTPTLIPGVHIADATPSDWGRTTANYHFNLFVLEKLQKLASDHRSELKLLFTKEAAALLYLLTCAPLMFASHHAGLHSLLRTGYLMWSDVKWPFQTLTDLFTVVPAFVREVLEAASIRTPAEAVIAIENLTGSDWPLAAGPILRRDGQAVCFDFAAATNRLDAALQFPAIQDRFANARADHFEDEVQALIDHSRWKASTSTSPLRRRTLARDGRKITDIDAIGEHEKTLLLISCKSTVYSGLYDIGEYSAVRNAASHIRDSVQRWRTIIDDLRRNPRGDNYDLSSFERLVGVVCTPQVVFVDQETVSLRASEGLPMAASVSELADWIGVPMSFWGNE